MYPRFQRARAHKMATRTSGNVTVSLTTWADVPETDLTVAGQVGDVLEIGASGAWGNEGTSLARLEPFCVTSARTLSPGGGNNGVLAWFASASVYGNIGGSVLAVLASGDLVSGQTTVRLRARVDTASARTLYATAQDSLHFWIKNLGPADPT